MTQCLLLWFSSSAPSCSADSPCPWARWVPSLPAQEKAEYGNGNLLTVTDYGILWEGGCCQEENLWAAELSWKPSLKVTCILVIFNKAQGSTNPDILRVFMHNGIPVTHRVKYSHWFFVKNVRVFSSWKKILAVLLAICSIQLILICKLSPWFSYKINPLISAIGKTRLLQKITIKNISFLKIAYKLIFQLCCQMSKVVRLRGLEAVAAKEGDRYNS